ncbi:ABC transporter ATP-binding protein/permease [Allofrancisella guangzhouensis]|uniref:ABC transmembrane type-1 domain-containing protein n=1 Tax=Allofrancisella guangzhouensis TaxID=594679 RepID=A0A0A8E8F3_9GAMM|nr:SbmA/BacA-like family transporter [Allofrancisella guangzhouensis]AJC48426.1 hypothetical protein SD28_01555 [Allofrancisella guangzhouensis]MBK2027019.1 ABC transporter ATP-binding protein/permease [Allofrancisella guangzhouensis]MBK2044209.1 ABC transporter ATP-binding protein/permease [Allofrancisella guangzhouensis]MBK2045147.1 ABC transporter ATP-binding protein/permease [Allofrancisella guangzhouensis]
MTLLKNIWFVTKPFWTNSLKFNVLFALFLCILLEFISVGLSVYLNYWNVDFYNSLQQYNYQLLVYQLMKFIFIIFFMLANSFALYVISQIFVIRMREYLTNFYTKYWLYSKVYVADLGEYDNSDERISYDIKELVTLLKNLFLGFVGSILTFVLFSWILWHLSGSFEFNIYGYKLTIHGYLFWLALLLAAINILTVIKVGKPLRKIIYDKQKYEAEFRFGLATIRNNNYHIHDSNLEKIKFLKSKTDFKYIVDNFYVLTFREIRINLVTSLFSQVYGIIGIFLSLPRYFARVLSFGQIMQINMAFLKVVSPLLFFIYSYEQVTELKTNVKRLMELKKQIDNSNDRNLYTIDTSQQELLKIDDLSIFSFQKILFANLSISLKNKQSLLIQGKIGAGKTTLLRVIKGVYKDFKGNLCYNIRPQILLMTSKPYFLKDDFKRAMFSPLITNIPSDQEFINILKELDVLYLKKFIGKSYNWNNILSLGEQQKLSFCKLFIKKYNLVLLDEATSNLDEKSQERVYQLLKEKKVTFISASHDQGLKKFHDKLFSI